MHFYSHLCGSYKYSKWINKWGTNAINHVLDFKKNFSLWFISFGKWKKYKTWKFSFSQWACYCSRRHFAIYFLVTHSNDGRLNKRSRSNLLSRWSNNLVSIFTLTFFVVFTNFLITQSPFIISKSPQKGQKNWFNFFQIFRNHVSFFKYLSNNIF